MPADIRDRIVAEALTWEGTPYHQHGRVKGVGVDCAMLPACVYEAVGLAPYVNPKYTHDWMMHQDSERYLEFVLPYAREITRAQALPGDLILWRFGRTFSHSAIILKMPMALHAVLIGGAVVRVNVDQDTDLNSRPSRFFTVVPE